MLLLYFICFVDDNPFDVSDPNDSDYIPDGKFISWLM